MLETLEKNCFNCQKVQILVKFWSKKNRKNSKKIGGRKSLKKNIFSTGKVILGRSIHKLVKK